MLKNLIYALLLHKSLGEKVNIANCNELWGMTNTMNRQTMYSMKIYSCVVNPIIGFSIDQSSTNIAGITSMVNTSNISNVSNIINETHITNITNIKNITSMINTSNIPNVTDIILNSTINNNTFIDNSSDTLTPSSSYVNIDSLYETSPSSIKDREIDNINQEEVSEIDYSSPSSSLRQDKLNIVDNNLDVGLIIGIVVSSCFVTMATIFGIIWYRNKKITNNISPDTVDSLKSRAPVAKPLDLNGSQISSKTDETVVGSPHPPLPGNEPNLKQKDLPNLPPPEINNTDEEKADNESKDIIDLETGNKEPIKVE